MKRVASLYLPDWPIDRLRRDERRRAPPPDDAAAPDLLALKAKSDAEHGGKQCDAPKNTGWRPGARWARQDDAHKLARPLPGTDEATGGGDACWAGETRADVARRIARLPAHQRPPMREMGRRSEAAEMPFKQLSGDDGTTFRAMPSDEAGGVQRRDPAVALSAWNAVPSVRYPGDGPHPDEHSRRGSNDPHAAPPGVAAFFDTGRTTAGTLARVCREDTIGTLPVQHHDGAVIVTAEKAGSRVQLAAVSPAALALGLVPGMALTQARASVPDLDVRAADRAGDLAALDRLAILAARRWTPVVQRSGDDGLLLDLTGVTHLHGGEARLAARLVRLLARHDVTARIAIADTAGAAWALARHGGARVTLCPPGAQADALAALPPEALRLDDRAIELLRRLGVEDVAALTALPRAPLVRRFGETVARRLDQALGRAAEPLEPVAVPDRIVFTQRFAEPIATPEAIAHWIGQLVPRLATALAEAGRGARALLLVGERVDKVPQLVRIGFARPCREPAHMLRLLLRRIEEIEPGYGIDALTLDVRRSDPLGAQPFAADLADGDARDLGLLVDALANRIGARRLWRHAPVESDVPERSVSLCSPLDPPAAAAAPLRRDDVRRLDDRAAPDPWCPRWPRPTRLLRRPERLDGVIAELPDRPPARFTWRGKSHRVVRADGPERIAGEWWRRTAERDAVRDYFQVEDEAGHRFWLFRRGDGERAQTGDLSWYMHGTFG